MASLKDKLHMLQKKSSRRDDIGDLVDIEDLVGKEILIKHDSGTWEDSYVIGAYNDGYGFQMLKRFMYVDGSTGEKLPDDEGILVSPIDQSDVFRHLKDDTYLMSTPHGGGGFMLSKYGSIVALKDADKNVDSENRINSDYKEYDDYLKSIGH